MIDLQPAETVSRRQQQFAADSNRSFRKARMAELVDALDSKSGFRKGVQVRFLFWAHNHIFNVVFLCPEVISDNGF